MVESEVEEVEVPWLGAVYVWPARGVAEYVVEHNVERDNLELAVEGGVDGDDYGLWKTHISIISPPHTEPPNRTQQHGKHIPTSPPTTIHP